MLRAFFRRHGAAYLAGGALLIACIYVQTQGPRVLGEAIDALGAATIDIAYVRRCALLLVLIALVSFLLRFAWRYLIIGRSRHLERELREMLCVKLQSLSARFYQQRRSGDLMAYAINDIGAVRQAVGPGLSHLLTSVSTAAFSFASMTSTVHTGLTLAALAPLPFIVLGILLIGRVVRRRFGDVQAQFALLSGHVNESISGMRVIKTFANEDAQQREYDAESAEMMRLSVRLTQASAAMVPFTQLLFAMGFVIAIFYGGRLVQEGTLTLGNFATFNAYLLMVMAPVVALGRIVNMLQRGQASIRRLRQILDEPGIDPMEMQPDASLVPTRIEARNLSFRYPDAPERALSGVSFQLSPGQTLGIVGPTGSGKSTLINLLMKFYPADAGMLFIGGRDIRTVPARAIRERTGYVPQEGFLFSGTLYQNIEFYQPGATRDDVLRAADMAGLTEDLRQMPHGLDTRVGERGAHVSGGQRQRTALARALIRRPDLLLLDDTLSAVDNRTQEAVLASLRDGRAARTTIIVSHKVSAVADADEILYLEKGRVKERGTHEALLALGGDYATLYKKQHEEGAVQ